ncbi:hypothetical protein PLANPX_4737 [Lacipirellula parvula]|uniref:Uncharacterized protein n=1 Tax=Lacipirellula parvula TaxID=2650471 RepID=A0A5K7XFF3_9BACT|nr:hypothetical protein PLANPX_4737 [Lacipirellula parvula]
MKFSAPRLPESRGFPDGGTWGGASPLAATRLPAAPKFPRLHRLTGLGEASLALA